MSVDEQSKPPKFTRRISLLMHGTVITSSKLDSSTPVLEVSIQTYLRLRLIVWLSQVSKSLHSLQQAVDRKSALLLMNVISSRRLVTSNSGKATHSTSSTTSDERQRNAKSN